MKHINSRSKERVMNDTEKLEMNLLVKKVEIEALQSTLNKAEKMVKSLSRFIHSLDNVHKKRYANYLKNELEKGNL